MWSEAHECVFVKDMGISDARVPLKTNASECSHFPIRKESDSVKEEKKG